MVTKMRHTSQNILCWKNCILTQRGNLQVSATMHIQTGCGITFLFFITRVSVKPVLLHTFSSVALHLFPISSFRHRQCWSQYFRLFSSIGTFTDTLLNSLHTSLLLFQLKTKGIISEDCVFSLLRLINGFTCVHHYSKNHYFIQLQMCFSSSFIFTYLVQNSTFIFKFCHLAVNIIIIIRSHVTSQIIKTANLL